jgi:hypothetical protein
MPPGSPKNPNIQYFPSAISTAEAEPAIKLANQKNQCLYCCAIPGVNQNFFLFAKQSLQYTGLPSVGLNGTSVSAPQSEQVALCISLGPKSLLGPPLLNSPILSYSFIETKKSFTLKCYSIVVLPHI